MFEINTVIMHILLFASLYFEVFLLITFFEWRETDKRASSTARSDDAAEEDGALPSVAILVPCFNEAATVGRTIRSLLCLDYPADKLTVVAIDDGSTDGTRGILEEFRSDSRISILRKENGGKHTALNAALETVSADLVGCLDADSFVEKNALREVVRAFNDPLIAAVTPAIKVDAPQTLVEQIQAAEYALSVFIRRVFSQLDALFITPGPFSVFRRAVLDDVGPYKAAYNTEDLEIALRLQARGYRIGNAHRAVVYTKAPRTLTALFRQRLRWSYGFLKNVFDYRFLLFNRRYGNLGLFVLPLSIVSFFGALYFAGTVVSSAILRGIDKAIEIDAIGLVSFKPHVQELFFISTDSLLFLVAILVLLTAVLVFLGKTLLFERRIISLDVVYYLALYGFLAPLWLGKATYNVITGEKAPWR